MMVLLEFEFQDKLSVSRLADTLRALRMSARKETKDLMWKSEYMGYHVVFLDLWRDWLRQFRERTARRCAGVVGRGPACDAGEECGACLLTLKAVENTHVLDRLSTDHASAISALVPTTTPSAGGKYPQRSLISSQLQPAQTHSSQLRPRDRW
jgi:hypothetical protein